MPHIQNEYARFVSRTMYNYIGTDMNILFTPYNVIFHCVHILLLDL